MKYEDMIDLDINANVTALEHGCRDWEFNGVEFYHCGIDGSGYFSQPVMDYCNNPSDAWPIILENEIGMNKLKCEPLWIADKGGDYVRSKNPLRAAMILYLMMNEK